VVPFGAMDLKRSYGVFMRTYECKYCSHTFTRRSILYKHQRTAKYCLIQQGKVQESVEEDPIYYCSHCTKVFTRKDTAKRHEKTCINQRESQNKQLLDLIAQLQQTIANLSQRSAGTTNRITMNLQPITDEEIQEHLEHLTIDFIIDGAKGYAVFANTYPFKDRVLCTDLARKKLKYKDGDGEVIEDGGGVKLTQKFFQAIALRNEEIINTEYRAIHEQVQQIAKDGTAYCADLTGLLTKASHLQELLIKCQQAARGEENELTKEFVNHLSKML